MSSHIKRVTSLLKKKSVKSTTSTSSPRAPLSAIHLNNSHLNQSITDCTCPICLEILVEPVVLPCKHELCLPCFNGMTDKTNFLCPMCRMRISTWSRNATNTNTLVNLERWNQIKKLFPNEVKDRIEGKSAEKFAKSIQDENNSCPAKGQCVSEPGEIRKEYESSYQKEMERLRLEKVQEEKISQQYIEQLIANEERISVTDYITRINANTASQPTTSRRIITAPARLPGQQRLIPPVPDLSSPIVMPRSASPTEQLPVVDRIALISPILSRGSQNKIVLDSSMQPPSSPEVMPRRTTKQRTKPVIGQRTQVVTDETEAQTSSTTTTRKVSQAEPIVRRTRSSLKRNIEDVKNIRTHLLTSIAEAKSNPKSSKEIITIDDSIDDSTDDTQVMDITPLKRRGSLRLKARQEAANDTPTRTPVEAKRSRQTNL